MKIAIQHSKWYLSKTVDAFLKELITGLLFNEKQEGIIIFYPVSNLSHWHWV